MAAIVFSHGLDPFTPLLTAAAFYWVLVNLIRVGLARFDRWLNVHLVADEQRDRVVMVRADGGARRPIAPASISEAAE